VHRKLFFEDTAERHPSEVAAGAAIIDPTLESESADPEITSVLAEPVLDSLGWALSAAGRSRINFMATVVLGSPARHAAWHVSVR
jgi:hypothetical protein